MQSAQEVFSLIVVNDISYSILDIFLGWRWNIKVDKSLRSLKDRSMSVSAVNTKAPGSAFAV